jgi:nucleotide-binding universal stress UspA family protein
MEKVLIALDYGPTAKKVAEEGFQFAKTLNAQVTLLHVISDPLYYSSTAYSPIMGFDGYIGIDSYQPDVMGSIQKASEDFLNKTKTHLGDESIQTLVLQGDAALGILDAASTMQANAIVMGTHSKQWLEAIVMGSVAEKVLHHAAIPLFIIPTKKKD